MSTETQTAEVIRIDAAADAPIVLPANDALLSAEFVRDGGDLILQTPDGAQTVIAGYFDAGGAPDLMVAGAVVPGRVVTKLARGRQEEPAGDAAAEPAPNETAAAEPSAARGETAQADAPRPATPEMDLGEPIATVSETVGDAFATRANGETVALKAGDKLYVDDVLSTSAEGSVGVVFVDGMSFSLSKGGRMVLDEFTYSADTETGGGLFSVVQGAFSFVSGKAAHTAPDALMIETPTMTIGVRGTKVAAEIAADGSATKVALLAEENGQIGKIMVSTDAGEQLVSEANHMVETFDRAAPPSAQQKVSSTDLATSFGETLDTLPAPSDMFQYTLRASPLATPRAQVYEARDEADAPAARQGETAQSAEATTDAGDGATEAAAEAGVVEAEAAPLTDEVAAAEAAEEASEGDLIETLAEAVQETVEEVKEQAAEVEAIAEGVLATGSLAEIGPESIAELGQERGGPNGPPGAARMAARRDEVAEAAQAAHDQKQQEQAEKEAPPPSEPTNAAPQLQAGLDLNLATILEDDGAAAPVAVSELVSGYVSDADGQAVEAIAITSLDAAAGTWAYSLDNGATYQNATGVTAESALLLAPNALIRFTPAPDFNGTAAIEYRAWDMSQGVSGGRINAGATGGQTPLSSVSGQAAFNVTPVNDAPKIDYRDVATYNGAEDINTFTRTPTELMAELFPSNRWTDPDGAPVAAIALTGVPTAMGTWSYSVDGGETYQAVGPVTNDNALLLGPEAILRLEPAANYYGSGRFTFRAWDQSSGAQGAYADTSSNGGDSAFSSDVANPRLVVAAVNDAPVLDVSYTPTVGVMPENAGSFETIVADIVADNAISDADVIPDKNIALVGADNSNGQWSYSLDGVSWHPLIVSETAALLLDEDSHLRFEPDPNFDGVATLEYRAWDRTTGSVGGTADTSANGGSTAFSSAIESAPLFVNAVNNAPVLFQDPDSEPELAPVAMNATDPVGYKVSDIVQDGSITDADDPTGTTVTESIGLVIADQSNGVWQYSLDGGATYQNVGDVNFNNSLLLGPEDYIRFVPNEAYTGLVEFAFSAWDGTSGARGDKIDRTPWDDTMSVSFDYETVELRVADPSNQAPIGDAGGAAVFDGASGYLDMGDAYSVAAGAATIEAWFYYGGSGGVQTIVSQTHVNGEGYGIYIEEGTLVVERSSVLTTGAASIDIGAKLGWNHVALVIEHDPITLAGQVKGYLNGTDAGWAAGYGAIPTNGFTGPITSASKSFYVGGDPTVANAWYDGAIADVRVYDVARSGPEIEADMTSILRHDEPDLLGAWSLSDGLPAVTNTVVGGNMGAVHGTVAFTDDSAFSIQPGEKVKGRISAIDPDDDAVTFTLKTQGENGYAEINADTGVWSYTPESGFVSGTDLISYQVTDAAGNTDTVSVSVMVGMAP